VRSLYWELLISDKTFFYHAKCFHCPITWNRSSVDWQKQKPSVYPHIAYSSNCAAIFMVVSTKPVEIIYDQNILPITDIDRPILYWLHNAQAPFFLIRQMAELNSIRRRCSCSRTFCCSAPTAESRI